MNVDHAGKLAISRSMNRSLGKVTGFGRRPARSSAIRIRNRILNGVSRTNRGGAGVELRGAVVFVFFVFGGGFGTRGGRSRCRWR
jgi:hypothetical protein